MQYNTHLGHQRQGALIWVDLTGNAANVRLLDRSNYRSFQANQRHHYVGGHYTRSPIRVQVPHDDHWFLVIDYGGYAGRGTARVQVLPVRLPTATRRRSQSSIVAGQRCGAPQLPYDPPTQPC